jgi:hypothetical protein
MNRNDVLYFYLQDLNYKLKGFIYSYLQFFQTVIIF